MPKPHQQPSSTATTDGHPQPNHRRGVHSETYPDPAAGYDDAYLSHNDAYRSPIDAYLSPNDVDGYSNDVDGYPNDMDGYQPFPQPPNPTTHTSATHRTGGGSSRQHYRSRALATFATPDSPPAPALPLSEADQRERNRAAASRCRQRERESAEWLEREGAAATERRDELAVQAARLRGEASELRGMLGLHVGCDCVLIRQYLRNTERVAAAVAAAAGGVVVVVVGRRGMWMRMGMLLVVMLLVVGLGGGEEVREGRWMEGGTGGSGVVVVRLFYGRWVA